MHLSETSIDVLCDWVLDKHRWLNTEPYIKKAREKGVHSQRIAQELYEDELLELWIVQEDLNRLLVDQEMVDAG
jgi:hypothetical protein